jgi:hypothetical protein
MHGSSISSIDELAWSKLQESFSLIVLVHAVPALTLNKSQIDELIVCRNFVVCKYSVITNGNLLNPFVSSLAGSIMLRRVRFERHLYFAHNSLSNIFHVFTAKL